MAWVYLIVAGFFEIIWVFSLKYSFGFTCLTPSIITVLAMILSFFLLAYAMKTLPMAMSYAVWTSIGIIGSTIIGILIFNESLSFLRLLCLLMVIAGVIGLKLTAS